jgi:hypothetical protein
MTVPRLPQSSRKRETKDDEDREKSEKNQDERLALLKKFYKKGELR